MIGASYRPSLRETVLLGAVVGVTAAAKLAVIAVGVGAMVAALPVLIVLRWVGFEDEIDGRYGDGGVDA